MGGLAVPRGDRLPHNGLSPRESAARLSGIQCTDTVGANGDDQPDQTATAGKQTIHLTAPSPSPIHITTGGPLGDKRALKNLNNFILKLFLSKFFL